MHAETRALAAHVGLRAGDESRAREDFTRAVEAWRSDPHDARFLSGDIVALATRFGGAEELVSGLGGRRIHNAWEEAALAIARADYRGAASIYATMGEQPAEAAARFDGSRALVDQGRIPEGLEMLEQSLRFWRRVDGRYYIDEAERLRTKALASRAAGDVVNR
jgi:hypothetical protein